MEIPQHRSFELKLSSKVSETMNNASDEPDNQRHSVISSDVELIYTVFSSCAVLVEIDKTEAVVRNREPNDEDGKR